jgi:LAGLIDADG endonuclease
MHEKDRALIQSIQDFFGEIGHVSKPNNSSMVEFRVNTVKDLVDVIIPHFFVLLLPLLSLRPPLGPEEAPPPNYLKGGGGNKGIVACLQQATEGQKQRNKKV